MRPRKTKRIQMKQKDVEEEDDFGSDKSLENLMENYDALQNNYSEIFEENNL